MRNQMQTGMHARPSDICQRIVIANLARNTQSSFSSRHSRATDPNL